MKKFLVLCVFVLSLSLLSHAQGTACPTATGAKIQTGITALTTNDATVVDGTRYYYTVSASNSAGESLCSNVVLVAIDATGTHSVDLAWIASTTANVTYNVYRIVAPPLPNPPGKLTATKK